ncbi:MAG: hypothetical protein Q9214_000025 [Letrouitia sp. 1 TL-2023]
MADSSDGSEDGRDLPQVPAEVEGTINEPTDSVPPHAPSTSPLSCPPTATDLPTTVHTLDSQPMTTTSSSSSSSSLPSANGTNTMDHSGPSPYGTRSRNRTGNTRPNYAEDKELDTDYDWISSKKARHTSNLTSSNHVLVDENEGPGVSTRRRSLTTTAGSTASKGVASNPIRDLIPGMSSFSVNPESHGASQPPSKKRKAPGALPSSTHATITSSTTTSSNSHSRKTGGNVSANRHRETNMLSFEVCQGYLRNGKLKADDGTSLGINDHVYLICEPPGEPYYLARIMEFIHNQNDHSRPIDALRVNWYYRPRDIQRKVNDTRVVFASMHSDTCPLTSLRGKCRIAHRSDIPDLDVYRKSKDSFWYEKMFDRYIHRYYEVIPTSQVINVPARVKKVLDERWKFVIVEMGRGKELTSAIKSCKRCNGYCASNDSVDCAMCKNTYHMNCVRPPLQKKPARGFAWSCGPCSRKQERKLEARNTPLVGDKALDGDDEEVFEEEEEDHGGLSELADTSQQHPDSHTTGPRPATAEQVAQAKLWPYRYLGIHCRVEDALDYDDRIYPRASSRLGPKHQANTHQWHGRPVELVKPAELRKKYLKTGGNKKDAKLAKETVAAIEAEKSSKEKRPKWVIDEPAGYVHRGEDYPNNDPRNTAKLQFRMPERDRSSPRGVDDININGTDPEHREEIIDQYIELAKSKASLFDVEKYSTNLLDKALELLYVENFNMDRAIQRLVALEKRSGLKEPELSKEELRKFEDAVAKYGSELRSVSRHVGKSQKHGEIVRFYYMWKKTPRGKQIWGNFEGRKGKKQAKQVDTKLVDDVADDIDDSAFDNTKIVARKRSFECKFCGSRKSPQWRRAPGTAPGATVPADTSSKNTKDRSGYLMVALCQRCADLWRKYGIQWENVEEVVKKVGTGGGRAWKRKIDEELLFEYLNANKINSVGVSSAAATAAASVGLEVPQGLIIQSNQDGSKKRQKLDGQASQNVQNGTYIEPPKKKAVEKPPEPPLFPELPKIRTLPCAVCYEMEPTEDQLLCCRYCRLTVHRNCYGVAQGRSISKWTCDMCANDIAPQVSTSYECVLCPVIFNEQELMEPPKVSHKKKSDREREKERLEREMMLEATEQYNKRQAKHGRPTNPREPYKRTSGNRWVHVTCAIWHPEIKFSNAPILESSEGFQSIPTARYEQVCRLCKASTGACVSCHQCAASFHVTCAIQYGFHIGFDVTPVKGSRKDVVNTATMGNETGNVTAVVYCREHTIKSIVHPMHEMVDGSNLNALQLFARTYKQADLSLTGTVRKAAIINSATRGTLQVTSVGNGHRGSMSAVLPITKSSRVSPAAVTVKSEEFDEDGDRIVHLSDEIVTEPLLKVCGSCGCDTSPKWHRVEPKTSNEDMVMEIDTRVNGFQSHSQTFRPCQPAADSHANGITESSDAGPHNHQAEPGPGLIDDGNGNNREQTSGVIERSGNDLVVHDLDGPAEHLEMASYLCHKCHMKNLRSSNSPPVPSTLPEPGEPDTSHAKAVDTPSPPPQHFWPPGQPVPSHEAYPTWPGPPASRFAGPPRIPNGVPHSPTTIPPAVTAHCTPPPNQYHTAAFRHQQQQHPVNDVPPTYHMLRNNSGSLAAVSYQQHPHPPPPPAPPLQPPRVQQGHSQPREIPSPPMHLQGNHGPHGPPRAEENPFAIPFQSPRQDYQVIYGSPRSNHERAETPPAGMGRNGMWSPGDGGMTNGASASPSLRNLLH